MDNSSQQSPPVGPTEQIQPSAKLPYSPSKAFIVLTALILILTLAVGGILLLRGLSPAPIAPTSCVISDTPLDWPASEPQTFDTSTWQTYRSGKALHSGNIIDSTSLGFEVRYPSGYQVSEIDCEDNDYVPERDYQAGGQAACLFGFLRVSFYAPFDPEATIDTPFVEIDMVRKQDGDQDLIGYISPGWGHGGSLHPVETVSFDTIKTQIWRVSPSLLYYAFFDHEDLFYDIQSDSLDFLKSVLATFRFIE